MNKLSYSICKYFNLGIALSFSLEQNRKVQRLQAFLLHWGSLLILLKKIPASDSRDNQDNILLINKIYCGRRTWSILIITPFKKC